MERFSRAILVCGSLFIIWFSWWQGAYNLDPHHWGLMLSNAKDLHEGLLPYKEIFIQYGILTTIFQAVAFGIGKNMLSIIVISGASYAIGLLVLYAIALKVLNSKKDALYVFILAVLFHPLSIYPWSNYIAFPFLMLGLYGLLCYRNAQSTKLTYCFLSGICLGLAILAREGLAPAIILLIPGVFALDIWYAMNWRRALYACVVCVLGALIPIALFFAYLYTYDLVDYWIKLSIQLPAIYANENFAFIKAFIFKALFKEIYGAYRHAEVRWILTSLFLIASIWVLLVALWRKKQLINDVVSNNVAKVAFASLLLVSSSLHLAEIFRIATGSIVGLVTLFAWLKYKGIAKPFFTFFVLWLGLTATYGNRGNYFYPTWETFIHGKPVSSPPILQGQVWLENAGNYYAGISNSLYALQNSACAVRYQLNETRDSLLTAISPLKSLQMAPFVVDGSARKLRPDLEELQQLTLPDKIVIMRSFDRSGYQNATAPEGTKLYAHFPIPVQYFMPLYQELVIYAPIGCFD